MKWSSLNTVVQRAASLWRFIYSKWFGGAVVLRMYLDQVTQIKLHALDELTDEALRGDQMFAIFLAQCSNLSRKIQLKISLPIDLQACMHYRN